MAKTREAELDRVTVTIPRTLMAEMARQMDIGHYASVSEWVREAIRNQLLTGQSAMERMVRQDPRIAESLHQSRSGETRLLDWNEFE
jgi:Arc/MetJ-type ribon-helix-helix transcriptional regulator